MNNGWISIHRSITDHWIWGCEKFTKGQAWVDLLINANHSENKVMIKGELINVDRGQQIRSQTTLSKAWKWDRKTVNKFLKMLEKDGMVSLMSTHLTTCITICNYNDFQNKSQNNPQHNGQHTPQPVPSTLPTNNNVNNVNKVNKENKAKRFTPPSIQELSLYILDKSLNVEAEIFMDYYIANGWIAGKTKMKDWKATARNWSRRGKNNETNKPTRSLTAVERVAAACRAHEASHIDNCQDNLPALEQDGANIWPQVD